MTPTPTGAAVPAQPDALRLADAICDYARYGFEDEQQAKKRRMQSHKDAAAELRRLHAENRVLKDANDNFAIAHDRLHAQVAALTQGAAERAVPADVQGLAYFVNSDEGGYREHATELAAREDAESEIAEFRKQAMFDNEWHDSVESIKYGLVLGKSCYTDEIEGGSDCYLTASPAHIQTPAETEHVAADVSKNGLESNMTGGTIYVCARSCENCGHSGINDGHATDAACNTCGWSGASPKEDHCPGCGLDGTMTEACPECSGVYALVADTTIDIIDRASHAQAPVGASPIAWRILRKNHLTGEWVSDELERFSPGVPPQDLIDSVAKHAEMYRLEYAYAAPTAQAAPAAPFNVETQDQIAAVMLQHGTEDQQRAALAYASGTPAAGAVDGPVLFVSYEQLEGLLSKPDPEEGHGRYLPIRRGPAGKFTHPLYAAPAPAAGAVAGPDQAPPIAPTGGMQELHDLLYKAQRTTGDVQSTAITHARILLSTLMASRHAQKVYGPYDCAFMGAGVWAGIADELPPELVGLKVYVTAAAPTPAAQVDDAACKALEAPSVTADAREAQMVVLSRDGSGKPTVWCDPEIAPIVAALNAAGLRTVASCAGHGNAPGVISLADGRSVVIARDNAECEVMTRVRGRDVNGAPIPPKGYTWMPITPTLAMLDAMRADASDRLDQRYSNLLAAALAAKGQKP